MASLLDLLESSAPYRKVEPPIRRLLEELVLVLEDHGRPLPVEELRRRAHRNRRTIQDLGPKGFRRIFETHGLFKPDPVGGFDLAPLGALRLPIPETPVVVLDVESTGGRPPVHRFIELALVRREPGRTTRTWSALADPGRPLPRYVTRVTGIRPGDLEGALSPEEVFRRARPMLEGAILVFHGAGPDLEYLNYESMRVHGHCLTNVVVCTTALARHFEPALTTMGLDRVLAHFGVHVDIEHRALEDALLTRDLYEIFERRFPGLAIERLIDLTLFQGVVNFPPWFEGNLSVDRLNELPARPGAFALRDERHHLIHADFTSDLRRELQGYFYSDRALPPRIRKWVRRTSYLHYLAANGAEKPSALVREVVHIGA